MNSALKLALVGGAIWIAVTLYTEGPEHAFGGVFASFTDAGKEKAAAEVLEQTYLYADAAPDPGGSSGPKKVLITDSVRERVSAHIQSGGDRNERARRSSGL